MATTIKTKNSNTTGNVPTSLEQGELAVNIADKTLHVGPNGGGVPVELLGGNQGHAIVDNPGAGAGNQTIATGGDLIVTDNISATKISSTETNAANNAFEAGTNFTVKGNGDMHSGNIGIGNNPIAATKIFASAGATFAGGQVIEGRLNADAQAQTSAVVGRVNTSANSATQRTFAGRNNSGTDTFYVLADGTIDVNEVGGGEINITPKAGGVTDRPKIKVTSLTATAGHKVFQYNAAGADNFYVNGTGRVYARFTPITAITSDQRLKNDGSDYTPTLDLINQVKCRNFTYKDEKYGSTTIEQKGLYAQEIPDGLQWVEDTDINDDEGGVYKTYGLNPLDLLKAIQELSAKVDTLKSELNALKTGPSTK